MKYTFINNDPKNKRLIAIFLGWAMSAEPFSKLNRPGYDIVLYYGYTSIRDAEETYMTTTSGYSEINVVAWSFGVSIANKIISERENVAIAVNGTPTPVSDNEGIPRHIFGMTLRRMNGKNLELFYSRICGEKNNPFKSQESTFRIEQLIDELGFFGSFQPEGASKRWSHIEINGKDAIIPPANQKKAWENFDVKVLPDEPHLPDFQRIIDTYIIDKQLIARRFTENTASYEKTALIQRDIAKKLMQIWVEYQNPDGKKILEAGCGTGFLTRLYSICRPLPSSIAVDLADSSKIAESFLTNNVGFPGKIEQADAERFIRGLETESFDSVVSSSTLQWFADIPGFLRETVRILKKDGICAVALFGEGTFSELREITGRSLNYPDLNRLNSRLESTDIEILTSRSIEFTVTFESGRDVMEHIKQTGVNALGSSRGYADTRRIISDLDKNPKLTYNSLFLVFRKK